MSLLPALDEQESSTNKGWSRAGALGTCQTAASSPSRRVNSWANPSQKKWHETTSVSRHQPDRIVQDQDYTGAGYIKPNMSYPNYENNEFYPDDDDDDEDDEELSNDSFSNNPFIETESHHQYQNYSRSSQYSQENAQSVDMYSSHFQTTNENDRGIYSGQFQREPSKSNANSENYADQQFTSSDDGMNKNSMYVDNEYLEDDVENSAACGDVYDEQEEYCDVEDPLGQPPYPQQQFTRAHSKQPFMVANSSPQFANVRPLNTPCSSPRYQNRPPRHPCHRPRYNNPGQRYPVGRPNDAAAAAHYPKFIEDRQNFPDSEYDSGESESGASDDYLDENECDFPRNYHEENSDDFNIAPYSRANSSNVQPAKCNNRPVAMSSFQTHGRIIYNLSPKVDYDSRSNEELQHMTSNTSSLVAYDDDDDDEHDDEDEEGEVDEAEEFEDDPFNIPPHHADKQIGDYQKEYLSQLQRDHRQNVATINHMPNFEDEIPAVPITTQVTSLVAESKLNGGGGAHTSPHEAPSPINEKTQHHSPKRIVTKSPKISVPHTSLSGHACSATTTTPTLFPRTTNSLAAGQMSISVAATYPQQQQQCHRAQSPGINVRPRVMNPSFYNRPGPGLHMGQRMAHQARAMQHTRPPGHRGVPPRPRQPAQPIQQTGDCSPRPRLASPSSNLTCPSVPPPFDSKSEVFNANKRRISPQSSPNIGQRLISHAVKYGRSFASAVQNRLGNSTPRLSTVSQSKDSPESFDDPNSTFTGLTDSEDSGKECGPGDFKAGEQFRHVQMKLARSSPVTGVRHVAPLTPGQQILNKVIQPDSPQFRPRLSLPPSASSVGSPLTSPPANSVSTIATNSGLMKVSEIKLAEDEFKLCRRCGYKSKHPTQCEGCNQNIPLDAKTVKGPCRQAPRSHDVRAAHAGLSKVKFYGDKINSHLQVFVEHKATGAATKAPVVTLSNLKQRSVTTRKRKKLPETVTISSDEEDPNNSSLPDPTCASSSVTTISTPSVTSQPTQSKQSAAKIMKRKSPVKPSTKAAVKRNQKVLLTRRKKMEDAQGNVKRSASQQTRVMVNMPSMSGEELEEEQKVEVDCQNVYIGSLQCTPIVPVIVTPDCILCDTDSTSGTHKVYIHPKDITAIRGCVTTRPPSYFVLSLTAAFGTRMRQMFHMQHSRQEHGYFDPVGPDLSNKHVVLVVSQSPPPIMSRLRKLLMGMGDHGDFYTDLAVDEMEMLLEELNLCDEDAEFDDEDDDLDEEQEFDETCVTMVPAVLPPCETEQMTENEQELPPDQIDESYNPEVSHVVLDDGLSMPVFSGPVVKYFTYPPPPEKGGISVTNEDVFCLTEGVFLNDVIIDFYLKYIYNTKLAEDVRRKTYIFNSFFYKRLSQRVVKTQPVDGVYQDLKTRRHNHVKTWTRHVDLFAKDFIIVPINEHSHWFLAIICFPYLAVHQFSQDTKASSEPMDTQDSNSSQSSVTQRQFDGTGGIHKACILVFDSLAGPSRTPVIKMLREYLQVEWDSKKSEQRSFTKDTIKGGSPKIPQQDNFSDCGLYVLQYAESFFETPIIDYNMPMRGLENWFDSEIVRNKRDQVRSVIMDLKLRYDSLDKT